MAGNRAVRQVWPESTSAVATGQIVALDSEGRPLVVIAGEAEPRRARSVVQFDRDTLADLAGLPTVAVVFEGGDENRPIIIGWVHDRLIAAPSCDEGIRPAAAADVALVDGRRVVLRAADEIELVCGASSILLRRDGHVVIKGAQVVSRATGANKIRGATVGIN